MRPLFSRQVIGLLIALSFFSVAQAEEYLFGRVIGISDGDTITILDQSQRQIKIRLSDIDTPESGQPYGTRAKKALSRMVFSKNVTIDAAGKDRYGRVIGRVYVDGNDVNAEMVRIGAAWVYRKYSNDNRLLVLEKKAREAGVGIWRLPEAQKIPPWEWRQAKRGIPVKSSVAQQASRNPNQHQQKEVDHREAPAGEFKCGKKRYCKEMSTCAEAMFYLQECGMKTLDRDGDGIPCESLCK